VAPDAHGARGLQIHVIHMGDTASGGRRPTSLLAVGHFWSSGRPLSGWAVVGGCWGGLWGRPAYGSGPILILTAVPIGSSPTPTGVLNL